MSRRSHHMAAWAVVSLMMLAATGMCAEENPQSRDAVSVGMERVVVFKDGYCLFVKRIKGRTDENGELHLDEVPDAAILGSFWGIPLSGRLLSMTAGWVEKEDESSREETCTNVLEILRANQGTQAEFTLNDGKVYSGIIHQILTQQDEAAAERIQVFNPYEHGNRADLALSSYLRPLPFKGGSHFVLRTESGDVLLPVAHVQRMQIQRMKTTREVPHIVKMRTKRLTFRFAKANTERELVLTYFCPGIRWIPTYRIELAPEEAAKKTAEIRMQAEMLNESEDLTDVPVDLVVGVPNFRFRNVISPLSLESSIRNSLEQAAPQIMGGQTMMSNAMFTQRAGEVRHGGNASTGATSATVELPAELAALGTQDLFIYSLPKMTLKKGDRVCLPVLSTTAEYRDVYTWNMKLKRKAIEAAPSGAGSVSPLVLSQNQVWRQVELTNNTKLPWTTGAVMFMQENRPLAQELLTYTSPGGSVRVPVTVAIDVRGSFSEREVKRSKDALSWGGHMYMRIDKQGALNITNRKGVPIDLEVTCRLGGKATETSLDGVINLGSFKKDDWDNYYGDHRVNNSSNILWRFNLKPGASIRPTVDFHFFLRQ